MTDVSSARLKVPGLGEKEISRIWSEFQAKNEEFRIRGIYPYMACFEEASLQYNVPLPLLVAVARGESNFDPRARSSKECLGIMQIRWPGTARDLGITRRRDLFDPCININAGARYLSWLLHIYQGDPYLALAAYNYGPNAVARNQVPEGARWYAAYIHRHLQSIVSRPYEKAGKVLILEFTFYKGAAGFVAYLRYQIKGLPLEVFKSQKYTYDVYYTYRTQKQKEEYIKRLTDATGIKPLDGGDS